MVSDEMSHKSGTVLAFIEEIIPILKGMDETLSTIHFWTDSPMSQYRNKYIFDVVANYRKFLDSRLTGTSLSLTMAKACAMTLAECANVLPMRL